MSINNSTPRNEALGTEDASGALLPSGDIRQPQHCPLFFLFTKKGEGQEFVSGKDFNKFFGADSLDKTYVGYTRGSLYASLALGNANASVVRRIIPLDAKKQKANITFFVEAVSIVYDEQVRNSNGSLVFNTDGSPKLVTPANAIGGIAYRIVTREKLEGTPNHQITDGTWQPTGATGVSKLYPILSLEASSYGAAYNAIGWVLNNAGMTRDEVIGQGEMLYNIKRFDNIAGNPVLTKTSLGTDSIKFSFTADARDYISNRFLDVPSVINKAWEAESGLTTCNDLGITKTYPSSYEALRALIVLHEEPLISDVSKLYDDGLSVANEEWYDFDPSTMTGGLSTVAEVFDFVGMSTTAGVVLQCVGNANISDEMYANVSPGYKIANIGSTSPSYFDGGLDGTMDQTTLEAGILEAMAEYTDMNSGVQNTALNPESNIWDPGYTVPTKLALSGFLALRTDTIVNFATDVEGVTMTDADRLAIAITLNSRMGLAPESEHFGTSVARYTINFGTGELVDKSFKGEFSQNYDLLDMVSKYMGAGNGKWKTTAKFDTWPGNKLTLLKNITPKEVAPGMRDAIWQANCIFADPKNMKAHFFTGAQTGHDNETSVLNNLLVIQAISYIVKLNDDAWREVSGAQSLSKLGLKTRVEGFINKKLLDAHDDVFIVYPEVTFTADDLLRNYSWHLNVHLGSPGMMTRQTSQITTHRIEELQGAN